MKLTEQDKSLYRELAKSPLLFVERVWNLSLQDIKPEYENIFNEISDLTGLDWESRKHEIKAEWFGDRISETEFSWLNFQKGKHISWQQWLILKSIEKATAKKALKSISIASGRGIGKSTSFSWVLLWFLFCHPDCQIPCTAPTSDQMYDVLWKEIALWIHRMPPNIRNLFDWESSHIRIKESPYTWFARAKTASKENPEALSGVHADYVLALVDEASGIEDAIFEAAQGIFSSEDAYLMMISNPTRLNGFFYNSQHKNRAQFQTLQFSSIESPLVHKDLVEKYGDDGYTSDKFRVNVLGLPPKEDSLDDKSYVQLIGERSINMIPDHPPTYKNPMLGVDPAGEGDNETAWGIRDNFVAGILATEGQSNSKSVARTTMTFGDRYKILPSNIVVDSFGVGADVGKEIALQSRWNIHSVNVGERPEDPRDQELFTNKRAEMYWKLKQWLEKGGQLVENKKLKEQLLSIRFRRTFAGKIELMTKREMRRVGLASPDLADAVALTFVKKTTYKPTEAERELLAFEEEFDPFEVL